MKIILVGFTGVGKTTLGHMLAEALSADFIDMDSEIEKKERRSIPEIFQKSGEAYFRDLEFQTLQEVLKKDSTLSVVATGGGVVERESSRKILRGKCVVYLKCKIEFIESRIQELHERPILNNLDWKKRFAVREPYYKEVAKYCVELSGPIDENLKKIISVLNAELEI